MQLSVEQARAFFDRTLPDGQTRSGSSAEQMGVFAPGAVLPLWERAEASVNRRLACIEIPSQIDNYFQVGRYNSAGELRIVPAYNKLLVARSQSSGEMALYMHFFIPDELYAMWYDGDLSEMFLNCASRGDYSGIEIYTTMDGAIAAAARYIEGKPVTGVFLGDQRLTVAERQRRLRGIIGGLYFMRRSAAGTRASTDGWWNYGGKTCFYDGGTLYFVIASSDGTPSVTVDVDGTMGDCRGDDENGLGTGSDSGGNNDGSNWPDGGGGWQPPVHNPGTPGDGPGGGGGGGGGGTPGGEPPGDGTLPPTKPPTTPPILLPPSKLIPFLPVNPLPDLPEIPDITPPDIEKKPCADSLNNEANPLIEMKISNDNKSWKSNTWGYVRDKGAKFHDGLDLLGESGVTEVYAMYGGKVVRVVAEQPNRIGWDKYPPNYTGVDTNGAGNRITIETVLPNGQIIRVSYWHLDVKEKNPYTQMFKKNDLVSKNQKIGVVGTSGNAYKKKPHLHLNTRIVGTKQENPINNPYQYLYTKFNSEAEIIRDC